MARGRPSVAWCGPARPRASSARHRLSGRGIALSRIGPEERHIAAPSRNWQRKHDCPVGPWLSHKSRAIGLAHNAQCDRRCVSPSPGNRGYWATDSTSCETASLSPTHKKTHAAAVCATALARSDIGPEVAFVPRRALPHPRAADHTSKRRTVASTGGRPRWDSTLPHGQLIGSAQRRCSCTRQRGSPLRVLAVRASNSCLRGRALACGPKRELPLHSQLSCAAR